MQWCKDQSLAGSTETDGPSERSLGLPVVGCGQGGALTKVPQAALTGVDTHLQHVHQSKVIYLGQGPLQKSMKSHPWGLDSGHSLPVMSLPLAVGLGQVADISLPHLCWP